MRFIVIIVTILAATFAGTTVYFARELQLERERPRAMPARGAQVAPAVRAPTTAAAVVPRPADQRKLPAPSPSTESEEEYNKRTQAEQARHVLKTLAEPEQREDMLVEYKLIMRNSSPRLAQVVGLSNEEADRLFYLLAQQQVESQERYSRCVVDPDCRVGDGHLSQPDARDQEIADLLGAQRAQQYENYKNTRVERESVDQLQSRLPETGRLSFEKSEALITALADERQKIHVEAAQRGAGMSGYGAGVGMVFTASDASTPQAQLESARANSQRMHERAAQVLNAEQLRVFDDMQNELLVSMRNQIRRKDESAAGS